MQPSAPHISNIMSSFQGNTPIFSLIIDPPLRYAECVTEYNVSVITDNQVTFIQVSAYGSSNVIVSISRKNVVGFNPCQNNYSFHVQTSNSFEPSQIINGYFNFSGKFFILI